MRRGFVGFSSDLNVIRRSPHVRSPDSSRTSRSCIENDWSISFEDKGGRLSFGVPPREQWVTRPHWERASESAPWLPTSSFCASSRSNVEIQEHRDGYDAFATSTERQKKRRFSQRLVQSFYNPDKQMYMYILQQLHWWKIARCVNVISLISRSHVNCSSITCNN